jgi:hypothetical protein
MTRDFYMDTILQIGPSTGHIGGLRGRIEACLITSLVSMTETEFEPALVTYAWTPSGLISTSTGPAPTPIVATTVLVAVLIAETLLAHPTTANSPGHKKKPSVWFTRSVEADREAPAQAELHPTAPAGVIGG